MSQSEQDRTRAEEIAEIEARMERTIKRARENEAKFLKILEDRSRERRAQTAKSAPPAGK